MNALERSLMTISCRDSDAIPKVAGAGSMFARGAERVQRMHNGIEVVYGGYHGDWMAHVIRGLQGHHEPQEELIFYTMLRYVRHRSRVVELGCFWAYYTQWFLREIPDSTAVAIEPDAGNLSVGQRNTALNDHTDRVRFINAWIGGQHLAAYAAPTESSAEPVSLPMLDAGAVVAEQQGVPVELLHMDIQGAELPFLRSIDIDVAKSHLRFIMVSTHHSSISGSTTTHTDCVETLRELGATILVEHDVVESFSGDGLILASTQPCDRDLWFPNISRNRAEKSLFKSS
jgi:FkbM family methyltransferase